MSLMGTLTKLALAYGAARAAERLSRPGGTGLFGGGASLSADKARAARAPGIGAMQEMLAGTPAATGFAAMQDMLASYLGKQGLTGAGPGPDGGLLTRQAQAAGLAALFAGIGERMAKAGADAGGAFLANMPGVPGGAQAEEAAGLMLRAMLEAAHADGEIDPGERARIVSILGKDAEPSDIAFVEAGLDAEPDPSALAADTPAALAPQVYAMSMMAIRLDTEAEAAHLDALASALGLTQEAVNALHLQMGVRPLYG